MEELAPTLTSKKKEQLKLLEGFPGVLKGTAGHTGIVEKEIHVGDASPIHCKPYRIPDAQ